MMIHRFCLQSVYKIKCIKLCTKTLSSKVPHTPVSISGKEETDNITIDKSTILLLERLSLVKYDTDDGIRILEDSIAFANKILHINTDHVQPLYSVLEKQNLNLRSDKITQGNCQKDILKNAALKEDDYFVAPLGNIPLHEVDIEASKPAEFKENEN